MDNREKIAELLRNTYSQVFSGSKIYYYNELNDKIKKKVVQYFDLNIDWNAVVAFVDTTIMQNQKEGIIFTVYGVYHSYMRVLEKPDYFSYDDIKSIEHTGKKPKSGTLIITDNSGYSAVFCDPVNFINLKKLIEDVIEISKVWADENPHKKESGKVKKIDLTKEEETKCQTIIHTASVAAGGVGTGLAQIPMADNAVIVPIQMTMITTLGAVFEIRVTESLAKSILASCATSFAGRSISQLLIGWIS